MARLKFRQRKALVDSGILPKRGAKPKSGHQIRAEARDKVKPTPEMLARKAVAYGVARHVVGADGVARIVAPADFDANVSTDLLDVMLSKGGVSQGQYAAATRFDYLRRVAIGRERYTLQRYEISEMASSDHYVDPVDVEEMVASCKRLYLEAVGVLRASGIGSVDAVTSLVNNRWLPSYRVIRALRGLEALRSHWRM